MNDDRTASRTRVNHLAHEKSPYLKQHAHNPVDWYPWGPEAFERARSEDKPVFLSIGYSTCHWCHVMAHESFENDSIAAIMNELFVNIKVDREERPDVDALYMRAVQAMSRQGGGWPLSVFLTPDLIPFFGGTYFPPEDRYGRPGFPSILRQMADIYRTRRGEIEQVGAQLAEFLKSGPEPHDQLPPESLLAVAFRQNAAGFDRAWGGFGGAPKFPRSMTLSFLLRYHHRHPDPETIFMVTRTLDAMAAGGIHDQIGGGFHRYATDERWLVPHFEKMLYDNALLARAYLEAYQATGEERHAAVARDIFAYLLRDLRAPEGAFYSAEDADSEGEEGKFYVWSSREVEELLGPDAALFMRVYDVSEGGNFEGRNILWTPRPLAEVAREEQLDLEMLASRLAQDRARLFEARGRRVRPHRDEKILTSWNALALGAFALGYRVLGDSIYLEAAEGIALFLADRMWDGRTLRARWAEGEVRYDGCLDDYAFFAWALLDLYESTFDPAHLRLAFALIDAAEADFATPEGGYYLAPSTHAELIARPQEVYDGALPSGNSVMVQNLLSRSEYTGDLQFRARAERALKAYRSELEAYPASYPQMLSALDYLYAGPREVVIAGSRADAAPLVEALWRVFEPNKVVLLAVPGEEGLENLTAVISGKKPGPDGALAYVCRDFACKLPTADPREMLELLR